MEDVAPIHASVKELLAAAGLLPSSLKVPPMEDDPDSGSTDNDKDLEIP